MKPLSDHQLANVQNYLLLKGHACPTIVGDEVHYVSQERGNHKCTKSEKLTDVLEQISLLRRVPLDEECDDFSTLRVNRLGVSIYQVFDAHGKLLYIEELPIKLWGKF